MKKLVFFYFALIFLFYSCSKQAGKSTGDFASDEEVLTTPLSDYEIHIFFGYDFNNEDQIPKLKQPLTDKFGAGTDGGLISASVYPKDYEINGKHRISMVEDHFENPRTRGMITMGAPEGLHTPLARVLEKDPTYKIISLFPQDDILGSQSVSHLVLSAPVNSEIIEQELTVSDADISLILDKCIVYMRDKVFSPEYKIPNQSELRKEVMEVFGDEFDITPFMDPETGIRASNHFEIKRKVPQP
ncbi:MAG: hypothetical protein IIW10_01305 [Spirochaetaceae bacterium]|nr:hypothetical protein [Spirochaetaceae bacterium]